MNAMRTANGRKVLTSVLESLKLILPSYIDDERCVDFVIDWLYNFIRIHRTVHRNERKTGSRVRSFVHKRVITNSGLTVEWRDFDFVDENI